MSLREPRLKWPVLLGTAAAAGAAITAVDNIAFEGEVSPIVVVGLLFTATALVGVIGGRRGWPAAGAVWVWIPLVHLVKRALDLPDTLHPNTYTSILILAGFSFVVASVGIGCGLLARGFVAGSGLRVPANAEPVATPERPRD